MSNSLDPDQDRHSVGTLSECQTVWIQIRTDILSVLIRVQTVCSGYQLRTKVAASKERVEVLHFINVIEKTFYHSWLMYIVYSIHVLFACFVQKICMLVL